MAYTVHNFEQGDVLYADQLNEMDAQIAVNEENIKTSVSLGMLAEDYSATKTYAVGDYCFYNENLYRCTIAITVVEEWNPQHWTEAELADDVADLKNESLTYTKLINGTLGFVTPQMYGAKGDGVADDTASIKNAITTGHCVLFPKGQYNVSFEDSVTQKQIMFSLSSNQKIVFDEGAVLNITGSSFAAYSSVFGVTSFPVHNILIDGATIQCEELHTVNPMGIRLETATNAEANQVTDVLVKNCTFINLTSAVYIVQRRTTGVITRQIKNVTISDCIGIKCLSSFVTADGENITIKNCFSDGGNESGAYDAVSVHSGLHIKIIGNRFTGYTAGQVINVRNSPENMCGSNDVLIQGNSIYDCSTIAIQISTQSGEYTYGCTDVKVLENSVINCATGIVISSGNASSNTPFRGYVVSQNVFSECTISANMQSTTTVWCERLTFSSNVFSNCGNFSMQAIRHCSISGNYFNLSSNAVINLNYIYYSVVVGNTFWTNEKTITMNMFVNARVSGNFFRGIVTITSSESSFEFDGNTCMNLLTLNGVSGYNVKTSYIRGNIKTFASAHPTGENVTFSVGDMYINTDPSSGVYGWVCTVSGAPGTWKAIALT